MYFKFFRKGRWRKDAPQMTGERVFEVTNKQRTSGIVQRCAVCFMKGGRRCHLTHSGAIMPAGY